jgi:hypothetical protein
MNEKSPKYLGDFSWLERDIQEIKEFLKEPD